MPVGCRRVAECLCANFVGNCCMSGGEHFQCLCVSLWHPRVSLCLLVCLCVSLRVFVVKRRAPLASFPWFALLSLPSCLLRYWFLFASLTLRCKFVVSLLTTRYQLCYHLLPPFHRFNRFVCATGSRCHTLGLKRGKLCLTNRGSDPTAATKMWRT